MTQIQNNKRAVIYCRVSTKEQAEEGNSLVTQENNCKEYALKHGYEIAETFIEQGESAKTADRTELQKLLNFCSLKKNNVQAVIAYKIDRISRNTDDYSQIRILLKRHNVEIKSTSEYFENTPSGRFMENIMANVAQFDNDVRTERSVGGMVTAMREGRYVWRAPIGYVNQKVNGKTTIVQTEKAPLIKMIFESIVSKTYTVEEIRNKIAPLGICSKAGSPLSHSYFYLLLKNEAYTGWVVKFGEKHKGNFEPIISERLFEETQLILSRKKRTRDYKLENPDFPLRRFVYHPVTNEKLTGAWSQGRCNKYAYYRYKRGNIQWTKHELENKFMIFFDSYSFNEELYARLKVEFRSYLKSTSENNYKNIEVLLQDEKILKKKRQALIEKNLNGIISDELLKESIYLIEEQLSKIKEVKDAKNEKSVNYGDILEYLHEFFLRPSMIWEKMPFHIKLKLQWFVFPKGVTLDNTEIRTEEICSLFKLKEIFLEKMSSIVRLGVLSTNTPKTVNSSPLQILQNDVQINDIKNNLIELDKILREQKDESDFSIIKNQKKHKEYSN